MNMVIDTKPAGRKAHNIDYMPIFSEDFKHFKDYAVSITGAKYAHADQGPVPDNFKHYFATLIHEEKAMRVEEINFKEYLRVKNGPSPFTV